MPGREHHITAGSPKTAKPITRAVILARGLGTRMREPDPSAGLSNAQLAMAATGVKAMIPLGRPLMDYQLSALAEAGFREVCLVVGPGPGVIREHYASTSFDRISLSFSIQERPLGTANAVLAAEEFVEGHQFLVINSDNYYPAGCLTLIRELHGPGLVAFSASLLVHASGIPVDRVRRYPVVEFDEAGTLIRMTGWQPGSPEGHVSMNCWRFDSRIFSACRAVAPSPRGELELPDAVQYSMESLGCRYAVRVTAETVFDLSTRGDVARVARQLQNIPVRL